MWLEPVSWREMRKQREKNQARTPGQKEQSGKKSYGNGGQGNKRGAKGYMGRSYRLHSGPFPPVANKRADKGAMNHSHDMFHLASSKQPLADTTMWIKYPTNRVRSVTAERRGPATMVKFPASDGGWYDIFAYHDQGVVDGVRTHRYSFGKFMSHGESVERGEPEVVVAPGYFQGHPVLEIRRLCADHHECYRTYAGTKLRVQAFFQGRPLADKPLTLITEQNWRQTKMTDAQGKVSFILIKESFPDEIDRRKAADYLLTMTHNVTAMGELDGVHFHSEKHIATLPLKVYPPPPDWQSKSMAYLIASGTFMVAAGSIAIRRKRGRRKP